LDFEISDVEDSEESRELNRVYTVSEQDDRSSAPPELRKVITGKVEQLVKSEREVLGPVMPDYYDLFFMTVLGRYRAVVKASMKLKPEMLCQLKRTHTSFHLP
jgi:hypothetical protein